MALGITSLTIRAQTDVQMSQYFEVPSYFNPAATGLEDRLRIHAGSRLQWIGIDNAPKIGRAHV